MPSATATALSCEHYHRYALALRFAAGRRVLDLGSGEGYGAALLAQHAEQVVGLEFDPVFVEQARGRYPRENLRFELGSITDPDSCAGETFDVITCFDALDQAGDRDQLLHLVGNRLARGGVLLCSGAEATTGADLRGLLSARFNHVALLHQPLAIGSWITGEQTGRGVSESFTLTRGSAEQCQAQPGTPQAVLLGIASDSEFAAPQSSIMLDPNRLPISASARRAARESHNERESGIAEAARLRSAAKRDAEALAGLRARTEHDAARLSWMSDTIAHLRGAVHELATENTALRAEHSAIAHRLALGYRQRMERLAPDGSRRRAAFERARGARRASAPDAPSVPSPITVTTSDAPVVSVVIPTYGQWAYTRRCLESIEVHRPRTPFEVIVVDDASPDDSAEHVARCAGVRLVSAQENLGFVGACNLGVEHARGELVMLLNNDTEVRPRWLDSLVELVETHTDIGLAGSMLVYPDGNLQECGGIIWSDGTGWNFGGGDKPDKPEYQVWRDVDYCSGAALLVRRELFQRLGGFDERFAPAYYEDTDLAFAVRAAGLRTVVVPDSVVIHHEGITNGTSTSSGVKRHQELNRRIFVEKWSVELAGHLQGADENAVWLASTRSRSGHRGGIVLVADHQVPRPDEDSGSVRMARLLDLLVDLDQRVVFFPMNHALPEKYAGRLHRNGITVIPEEGRQSDFLRDFGEHVTMALLSRPQVASRLAEPLRHFAPRCQLVYDTVDLHFLRLQRQADLAAELGDEEEARTLRGRAAILRELELGLV
ncbi:MAG: glycosyltransferase, partial [Sciscionella sp.]